MRIVQGCVSVGLFCAFFFFCNFTGACESVANRGAAFGVQVSLTWTTLSTFKVPEFLEPQLLPPEQVCWDPGVSDSDATFSVNVFIDFTRRCVFPTLKLTNQSQLGFRDFKVRLLA